MDSQFSQYLGVLVLLLLALIAPAGMIALSMILGKRGRTSKIKETAYECGMLPVGEGSTRLSVKFYHVAMLFILFDIEVVFMYPWAVCVRELGWFGFTEMVAFMLLLLTGLIYILKKGVLNWR